LDWRASVRRGRRKKVLQAHVGVWMWRARRAKREVGKRVRRRGRRRARGSIVAVWFVGSVGERWWWWWC
jgi:hypothetical protein